MSSVVVDDFKYSFFFYLDIVATLSIVSDIPWMLDLLIILVGERTSVEGVNAVPGVMFTESTANGKIEQVFKSLRLIRLIRIIKLYKYIIQSKQRREDNKQKQTVQQASHVRFKKVLDTAQANGAAAAEEETESLFKKETDPSKLGKALSDQNTREVIIGVLLMLMVLPLLSHSEIDYCQEYGLREIFWIGRSDCTPPEPVIHSEKMVDVSLNSLDHFYCST